MKTMVRRMDRVVVFPAVEVGNLHRLRKMAVDFPAPAAANRRKNAWRIVRQIRKSAKGLDHHQTVVLRVNRLCHPFLPCRIRHPANLNIPNPVVRSRRSTAPVLLQCQSASMSVRPTRKTTNTANSAFRINRIFFGKKESIKHGKPCLIDSGK